MSDLLLARLPALRTVSPAELVKEIVRMWARGVSVYITRPVSERIGDLLEKLGIEVVEVRGEITDASYILIDVAGDKIHVKFFKSGSIVRAVEIPLVEFESVLREMVGRRRSVGWADVGGFMHGALREGTALTSGKAPEGGGGSTGAGKIRWCPRCGMPIPFGAVACLYCGATSC